MQLAMVAYFDLGRSFGLGDTVFPENQLAPETAIGLVGIRNPLGRGLLVNLAAAAPNDVDKWRHAAADQVKRPEMETGWSAELGVSREAFDQMLTSLALHHPFQRCDLTVFAIGTAFVRLNFASGIPIEYLNGMSRCFEFAAYTPDIARALHGAAEKRLQEVLRGKPNRLAILSARELPPEQSDAKGYKELLFIPSFTDLVLCTDPGDSANIPRALQTLGIGETPADLQNPTAAVPGNGKHELIRFEYHGRLHYTWPACLLQPNEWDNAEYPPEDQIARMFECIKIAHVFHGTLEAFERLFQGEIREQVDGYVRKTVGGRDPQELNRLRTLALAVVNLTNFNLVTPTDEDQAYFTAFDEDAHIRQRQELITKACETLYNVQVAETKDEDTRRQNLLNAILFLLTSLTLVSVTADAYNFVREQQDLVGDISSRLRLLVEFVLAIALLATLIIFFSRPRKRRSRKKRASTR